MKKAKKKRGYVDRSETFHGFLDKEGLLSEDNPSVTLSTLRRAASAVGRNLRVELE